MARAMAAEGSQPFEYMRDGAPRRLGYWSLPASAWNDPDEACLWGARSLGLARAAAEG
jgi:DNA transformation protein